MKRYIVKYISSKGRVQTEELEFSDKQSCRLSFEKTGKVVLSVEDSVSKNSFKSVLSIKDQNEFSSIISSLLESSLEIKDALLLFAQITEKRRLKELSERLIQRLDKGMALSSAILCDSVKFPAIVYGLLRIGEKTGNLSHSFKRIHSYTENRSKIMSAVSGALAYPVLVLCVMIFGSLGIAVYVLPNLMGMFSGMGPDAEAQFQLAMNNAQISFFVIFSVFVVLTVGIIGLLLVRKISDEYARKVDSISIHIPFVAGSVKDITMLDFCYGMEALVSAGLAIDDALLEVDALIGNRAIAASLAGVRRNILKGQALSVSFLQEKTIPSYVSQWIAVGERTGKVNQVFFQLRLYYRERVERWSKLLLNLAEPLMSVCIGAFILTFIFMFVIPFITVYTTML